MSFTDGIIFLRKNEPQKAMSLFEEIIKTNPDLFWSEFSRSMDLNQIDPNKATFGYWHTLARAFIQNGKLDITERLYSIMIQKENALEYAIDQAQKAIEKRHLEQLKSKTECNLVRDYCQLGIVQLFKAAVKLDPEILARAEENYLKAYREDLKSPTPPVGRAWWNLASSMISRAQVHLVRKDYLPSFLIGWLSVEMSLRWIWSIHVASFEYKDEERKDIEEWDLSHITHVLYQFGKLNRAQKEGLNRMRGLRNQIMHTRGVLPRKEDAQEVIQIARELLTSYQPSGILYRLKVIYQTG